MAKKGTKTDSTNKKQQREPHIIKAMLKAEVPSACYELSAKPASHTMSKDES